MASNDTSKNMEIADSTPDEAAIPKTAARMDVDSLQDRLQASAAAQQEANMSVMECLRRYPKAIIFSAIISLCIVMEGYDINLLQGLYAFHPFQKRYGDLQPDGSYELTAAWQAGLGNGASVGEILGLMINGYASERFGYRRTVLASLFFVSTFIFILFFAPSVEVLLVGEILCGIPWGVFQTLTTVYASEVCPAQMRPYLTTYVNLCWVIGTLLGQGILRAFVSSDTSSEWAYRIPFAIQWAWPIPIAIGVLLAPESPWWLVRRGRLDDAKKALAQLTTPRKSRSTAGSDSDGELDLDSTVKMMRYTHEYEQKVTGDATYLDCFRGTDLRRTEITCVAWAIQNLSGSGFLGYSVYFFEQAGLKDQQSFDVAMGQYALGAMGTIMSWFLIKRFDRRSLYLTGLASQVVLLTITGCLGIPAQRTQLSWAIAVMMVLTTGVYDSGVGPVCYTLVPELASNRLRTRTVVLARVTYNIINIIMNVIIPYMLNPTAWNWGAKSCFFYAGLSVCCFVWTYFRLPESKDRTFAELDVLFSQKVSARKFKSTNVALFDAGVVIEHDGAGHGHSDMKKDTAGHAEHLE